MGAPPTVRHRGVAVVIPAPMRTQVRELIARGWEAAVASGDLASIEESSRPRIEVERPANPEHGDLSTNLAMRLARPYRKPQLELATLLAAKIVRASGAEGPVEAAEVAHPGFINLRLRPAALTAIVDGVLATPEAWGQVSPVRPRRVNVEFVSANPTGPLTIGNARGAFVGDLLCRVLEAGGQTVTREYYFNDSGAQVTHLGESVVAGRRGEPVPDDGYRGAYV